MKKYNVTVNGVTYEVVVEEAGEVAAAPAPQAPQTAAPAAPKAAPAPAAKPAATKPAAGAKTVNAPMPGTILKVNVKVGDAVKKNDLICILEAMKMENEIFAAEDGTVTAINTPQGTSVNTGDAIVTLG
ncbi:MAG: acetyl-CoA carboxylase biotin carboxyl carrier protein subunit [Eubacteriales bacterium]|nr:acetyl-CoA carboxylase biotin carboxyl carrier protein subunit [Clostridiales bacterium]MDD7774302.1 acetyl-CoA carboxylase biotin carboxyl carrier protein subunit [Eubacteriales bacterium]MDY3941409.1 acetyl-CoA carboxylase biotin carboxyl carrier protein subunit [Eubacteriales bacterium]